jgi:pimeloyl-ACP methyl ester carboxylesterase
VVWYSNGGPEAFDMATARPGWVCSVVTIGSTGVYMAAMNDALLRGYAPKHRSSS